MAVNKNVQSKIIKDINSGKKNTSSRQNKTKNSTSRNKNQETKISSTPKNIPKKKSNYQKMQQQIQISKQLEKEKQKKEQIKKQQKQQIEITTKENKKIKKNKIKKSHKESNNKNNILKKVKLILLSFLIKFKNLIIKVFKIIKNIFKNLIKFFQEKYLKIRKIINDKDKNITKKVKKDTNYKINRKKDTKDILREEDNTLILKSLTGKILPVSLTKWDKKRRRNIYIKEALLFTIIFTLIDAICFYNFSFMNILTIFDNNIWNLILIIALTLLLLLIISYIFDSLISEFILIHTNLSS